MTWPLLFALLQTPAPKQPSLFDKPDFSEAKFEVSVDAGTHASASAAGSVNVPSLALLHLPAPRASTSPNPQARADHDEARRLENAGQPAAAATFFARAAERDPSPAHVLDAAVHLLAHGAPKRAEVFLEHGLRANSDNADLRLALGLSHFAQGRHERAKDAFLAVADARGLEGLALIIEAAPALAPSLIDSLERSPYHQALALLRSPGRDDDAEQRAESLLLRVIDRTPDSYKAHFELARLYTDQKRAAPAERALLSAIQANPDHEMAHFRLAHIYQRSGRKAEAAVHFDAYRRLHASRLAAEENERKRRILFIER